MPSRKKSQKILIPKGMIDPNEDTLIEIPTEFKRAPMVVATRQGIQETSISVESSTKERDGTKLILTEDKSTIKIIENEEEAPRSSLKRQENIGTMPPLCCIKNNPELQMKYKEMEKARKELEESAFLTATSSQASTSISPRIFGATESCAPRRSSLSTRSSCDRSLQCKPSTSKSVSVYADRKPNQTASFGFSKEDIITSTRRCDQNAPISSEMSPKPKKTKRMINQSTSVSDLDLPKARDVKDREDKDGFSFIHRPCSTPRPCADKASFEVAEKGDVPLIEKDTCGVYPNKLYLESGRQQQKEDKNVHSKCSTCPIMVDKSSEHEQVISHAVPKRSDFKSPCKECDHQSSEESYGEDQSSQRKKRLREFYNCSNIDIDYVYLSQLKRQFDEAKRKLEDAVMLASMSLKQLASKKYVGESTKLSCSEKTASSICDSVPERDICVTRRKTPEKRNEEEWHRFENVEFEEPAKITLRTAKIPVNITSTRSSYSKSPLFDTDRTSPFLKDPKRSMPRSCQQSKDIGLQTESTIISPMSITTSSVLSIEKNNSAKSLELLNSKSPSPVLSLDNVESRMAGYGPGPVEYSPKMAVSSKPVEKRPSDGKPKKCASKSCSSKGAADCCCEKAKKVQDQEKEKARSIFIKSSGILK